MKQHLKSRHCDLDLHRPIIDNAERTATFYLWNLSGQLVGYQQYRPEGDWNSVEQVSIPYDIDIDAVKEEILSHNLGSFVYDW